MEKGIGVHVQRMLEVRRYLYTGENDKVNVWKKLKGNLGTH